MDSKEILKRIMKGEDPSFLRDLFAEAANKVISDSFMIMEEEEPDKYDIQGTDVDPALDPSLEREYFLKMFEVGENVVTIKTIGVGRNKPVSVYINDVRWEMFPGPVRAEKESKTFITSKHFEGWRGSKTSKQQEEAASAEEAPAEEENKPEPPKQAPPKDEEKINKQEAEKKTKK